MYNIIATNKYNELLKQFPVLTENPNIEIVNELRKKLGCGMYNARLLMQRAKTIQEAINLHYDIVTKLTYI